MMKIPSLKERGLSPMVATIVLIAMVMVIAGILAAGITGSNPERPQEAGVSIEGLDPGSSSLSVHMQSGKTLLDSYSIKDNDQDRNNDGIVWEQLELRVAGETVDADIVKATSAGEEVYAGGKIENDANTGDENVNDNLGFSAGDIIDLENVSPTLESADEVTLVWTPNDQILFTEEV